MEKSESKSMPMMEHLNELRVRQRGSKTQLQRAAGTLLRSDQDLHAAFHADLVTMSVVWVPLYLMYEISIWVTRIFGRKEPVEAPAAA